MNFAIKNRIRNKTIDYVLVFSISMLLCLINYICLGFASSGINVPFSYGGGDDITQAVSIKTISDFGWIGTNRLIGAPYEMTFYDFQTFFLMNFENLTAFIISRFVKDPYTVFNLQYLFTFALCGFTAFIVLRYLKIKRIFATIGALLYGMSPYIYSRSMSHYCLGVCYFVPLSILLCVYAFEDDSNYLSLKNGVKSFFCYKKNITMIVFSLFIANNGIGYYPFFTCFFLCITALITVFNTKSVDSIKKSVIPICCIVFFMLLTLIPVVIYKLSVGSNDIAHRSIADLELYGLKATQLFIPTNDHHLPIVNKLVSLYNSHAPLVTENRMAYMGIFACAGFVLMCLLSFVPKNGEKYSVVYFLFPKLTLWALLFFSIGGLITFLCLITNFRFLRSFNRVSIFIEFMGIATTCYCMQSLLELSVVKNRRLLRGCVKLLFALFSLYCIYEQHPSIRQNINARAVYKSMRENDRKFVEKIELQLQENDAVFQLPYHKFPEAGPVRNMSDYQLFAGYLNSSKLRWSYGGMKGRESDKWNEIVSSLPTEKMIRAIVQSGFRGIYIDSRAYTDEEMRDLCLNIESVLNDEKPIVSENGFLYFYNLYPYLEKHPELLGQLIFDVQHLSIDLGEPIYFYGLKNNSRIYITTGLSGTEENFTWTEGERLVMQAKLEKFDEERLVHAFVDCYVFNGKQRILININKSQCIELFAQDGKPLEFDFKLSADGKIDMSFEFPDSVSPAQLGVSDDSRQLSLALKTITFSQPEMN